uniref:Uncharacterized protein n=1 Tax=Lygus hesperus TaxID=30085 RepID=A0A146L190_LYGHE
MAPLASNSCSCRRPPSPFQSPILYRRFSTSPAFRTLQQESSHKMRAGDELLCGYKERVRARLQELMVQEGYIPSHPLVTATSLHLNLSTASEVAANYGASNNAVSYYQGCDLFYRVPQRAATPLSECDDSPRPKTTTITL